MSDPAKVFAKSYAELEAERDSLLEAFTALVDVFAHAKTLEQFERARLVMLSSIVEGALA